MTGSGSNWQDRYVALCDAITEGVLLLRHGRIAAFNQRALALFTCRAEQLTDATLAGLSPELQPDGVASLIAERETLAAATNESQMRQWQFQRFDGRAFTAHLVVHAVADESDLLQVVIRDISDKTRVAQSQHELDSILDNMLDTYYQTDKEGNLARVSPAVQKLLGYYADNIVGLNIGEIYTDHFSRQRFLKTLIKRRGVLIDYELQLRRHDRSLIWASVNARYRRDAGGNVIGYEGTVRDISERKRADNESRKLSTMLEQTADSVLVTNKDGVVEYVNPAFEEITGFPRAEVIGKRNWLLRTEKKEGEYFEWVWKTIGAGHVFRDIFVGRKKDGSVFLEDKTITPVKDDTGTIAHFIATGKDITERMQMQGRLSYPAQQDILTELPNLSLCIDRLNHALQRKKEGGGILAVLAIDIDRFKSINASFSHDIGDQALQAISERLRRCVRDSDTVARIGGDEFAVILEDMPSTDFVAPVVRKILHVLAQPFDLGERQLRLATNIGVSLFPADGDDASVLIKQANLAMYRAKEQGSNSFKFYSVDASMKVLERQTLEMSLRSALERNELVLHYQPQIDVLRKKIVGMEALLRWKHPELGFISPSEFIPLMESSGLVVPIGSWALQAACVQAVAWQKAGYPPFRMSVNLTVGQVALPDLKQIIKSALDASGLDPQWLELEFFESILVQHPRANVITFNDLRALGIRLALDDYGGGISSISYLSRLPIDTLKVDRTFVTSVVHDRADAAVVRAALAVGKALNMRVVAKGVENEEQMKFLRLLDCEIMQGFYFSAPRVADAITSQLQTGFLPSAESPVDRLR